MPKTDLTPSRLPNAGAPESRAPASPGTLFLACTVLLLAWGFRLFAYSPQELGLDGHLSAGLALLPTARLLEFLTRDVHPPLYYLLLKAWFAVAGVSFLSARWLSLAAGLLTLALLYRLATSLYGRRGALASLLITILSPAHLAASATVRDFGPGLLLSVGSLVIWRELWRDQDARRRRVHLVALALLTALALATWYLHALFVLVQLGDLIVRRRLRRGPLVAIGFGLLAQLPWLVVAGPPLLAKFFGGVTVSGNPPAAAAVGVVAERTAHVLSGAFPEPIPAALGAVPWALLTSLGLARGFTVGRRAIGGAKPRDAVLGLGPPPSVFDRATLSIPESGAPLVRWAVLSAAGLALGAVAIYGLTSIWAEPNLLGRYALVVLPWAFLCQSAACAAPDGDQLHGATGLPGRGWRLPGSMLLALAVLVLGAQTFDFAVLVRSAIPWEREPSVAVVDAEGQPGDAVVFSDHARYGLYRLRRTSSLPAVSIHFAGSAFLRDDVSREAETLLSPLLAQHRRIWFSYDQPAHAASLAEIHRRLLADRFLVQRYERGSTVVELFAPIASLVAHESDWRFGNVIALTRWSITPSIQGDEQVFVELRWQVVNEPGADYKVFAHLVDANGERIAQHDGVPMLGLRPTSGWKPGETIVDRFEIRVPKNAVPGRYSVLVGLYRGEERLRLEDGSDHVRIGPVTVSAVQP